MANITDKTNLSQHGDILPTANWISQINAGGQTYDIATHHNIIFKDGSGDATGVKWNGLTDLEIVIPSITDIVQTPIEFVGTVKDGNIEWKNGHSAPAGAGNLVFITNDCTFEGIACEAGDMAIFDGEKWNIVTGENQVELVGTTDENNRLTIAVGSVKDVLTVEGKTLALTLDYKEITKHIVSTPGGVVNVDFTKVAVDNDYIKLVKAADQTLSVGVDTTFDLPTELASDVVTLKNATGLVNSITWGTFTQGTQTDSSKNSEKKLDISGGSLTLSSGQAEGHFVDGVSMGDVTFVDADATDTNKIHVLTGITAGVGAEFLNGIHITGEDETADFTIAGFVKPTKDNVTFVEGLVGNLTPVTSITAGDVKLADGTNLVATGFGAESETVGDVLSSVTVTANNDATVLNRAYVENNVLMFGTANVTNGVTVGSKYKSLTKQAIDYTAPEATNTNFVTSGFEKVANVDYTFDRGNETTYTPTDAMWKLNTPDIVLTKGTYTLNQTNMKATVPAQSFVTTVTPGELPTWTGYDFDTTDITGTVDTTLTTTPKTLHVVDDDITTVTLPGAYTLEKGAAEDGVSLTVGKAGDVKTSVATVDLSGYITGIKFE